MLEQMINAVVTKKITLDYPHLKLPGILKARVVSDAPQDGGWYRHILKILDKNGETDERFPEIPGVYARQRYEAGATVAVVLMYGELDPYILGEVR